MVALMSGGPELKSKTFSANESWTVPAGVTNLVAMSGKGASGTPQSSGTRTASSQTDSITGHTSGSGPTSGSLSWGDFQADVSNGFSAVNGGGSGSYYGVIYHGYPGTNTYDITLQQGVYSNAIAGTATVIKSAGWKNSGPVLGTDYGFAVINYTQSYTIAATTGASATGFGKTFPGGVGGAATVTNFSNVPVTPLSSYNVVVPAGGSITITYYQ